ncbi:MAG: PD-(D/E)XK nuclease family protein [Clostridia bacterium]|nr:PD-(D/E)XK nuclease family protein [Clostridia bacterium]
MIYSFNCAALSVALEELKKIVKSNEDRGIKTVIFCEDRLTLAAERTVCAAVEGTFLTSVYTFARFLSMSLGRVDNVLSRQGSAMAVRKIIGEKKDELTLFKKLSSAGAAETVYDTIALLYSSRVSSSDAGKAAAQGGLLGGKLHDLSVIYKGYEDYLESTGFLDRNGYLKRLPEVIENSPEIRGNAVIFLGFQALTCMAQECVRAAFSAAGDTYGLFIGGAADVYVNEASAAFTAAAQELGGCETHTVKGALCQEADFFREGLFNPESFKRQPLRTARVNVFEAADEEEEMEFIAAKIKKHVIDGGVRYAKISVMLPDIDNGERVLSRVFSRFNIPYYADRQRALSEHPLCAFILNYVSCAMTGCTFSDVDAVISSPFFPAERRDKDIARNYFLRFAAYRGGIKRAPKEGTDDIEIIEKVRKTFLEGFSLLNVKGGITSVCAGICAVLNNFGVENTLKDFAVKYRDIKPAAAQFSARAYESVLSVVSEAGRIADGEVSIKEFLKILKSGFAAMKVSLIPPKGDAVFVGDLTATANTGSEVVFAARLSGDVTGAGADTSLLTDRELAALEKVNLNISPRIRQVNARKRETCALNACAFRGSLYLTYPARMGGEESVESEIISYAKALFRTPAGGELSTVEMKKLCRLPDEAPYYCSEKLPAIKYLCRFPQSSEAASVYEALKDNGLEEDAALAVKDRVKPDITCGERLYLSKMGSLSPTALETYFSCPYLGFMRQGLKAYEREEGAVRATDTGNFIHCVLQDLAKETASIKDMEGLTARAEEIARTKLNEKPYSSLADSKSGEYVSEVLIEEAVKVSQGMYSQLINSSFKVRDTECPAEVKLYDGVKVYGRIDRVDESGDLVRVIDYKTGNIDATPAKYYSGAKLQLPLYLLSASEGKRAAGAYYFPAALEYREKEDGVFRLQGFMDGSDEVVSASDSTVKAGEKSGFVSAYYQGRRIESAMTSADFESFISYSRLVAAKGAREMLSGNITPSPAEGTCKYCKAGGSCGVTLGRDCGERKVKSVRCSQIAEIARKEGGQ